MGFYGLDIFPAVSIRALMGTQSTDLNQWPGLVLSSLTTGLLVEWM